MLLGSQEVIKFIFKLSLSCELHVFIFKLSVMKVQALNQCVSNELKWHVTCNLQMTLF